MRELRTLGKHAYYVDGDIIAVRAGGEFSLAETRELMAACYQIGSGHGYWLVLLDTSAGASISADARRYVAGLSKDPVRLSATALYGASLVERTFVTLITNAIKMLNGVAMPITVHRGEPEARAWLGEMRREFRSQLVPEAPGPPSPPSQMKQA